MKLPGVESADISLEKASADIRLKPDNHVTMPQLRVLLKNNGYPTRDGQVDARGRIVEHAGKLFLDLLNGSDIPIESHNVALKAGEAVVEVTGVSRATGKAGDRLLVQSVK